MANIPSAKTSRPLRCVSGSATMESGTRQDDSWVELSSQPSSSSLSSIDDATAPNPRMRPRHPQRRTLRPSNLNDTRVDISRPDETSSQEEYDESESESDRVMTSSGEGDRVTHGTGADENDDDDGNRTAINHPIQRNVNTPFTPQPNAFSHPPSAGPNRHVSTPGSYFPFPNAQPLSRTHGRQSFSNEQSRLSHLPDHVLSRSYSAAAHHDEALRNSLNTLLSCAAAARRLPKPDASKVSPPLTSTQPARGGRMNPMSFRIVPESELSATRSPFPMQEPIFPPTLRRISSSNSDSNSTESSKENKRKALAGINRSSSRERRLKKARRSSSSVSSLSAAADVVTPTLFTWVVSAGVVVILSALSFTAGYSIGKEAGYFDNPRAIGNATEGVFDAIDGSVAENTLQTCASEMSRTGLGLRRSLARSAVNV